MNEGSTIAFPDPSTTHAPKQALVSWLGASPVFISDTHLAHAALEVEHGELWMFELHVLDCTASHLTESQYDLNASSARTAGES